MSDCTLTEALRGNRFDCALIEELLSARLDEVLTAEETALVEAHLAHCPTCRTLYDDLSRIDRACSDLAVTAPDTIVPRVLRAIAPRRSAGHWRRWGGMAAAFAVVLLGVWSMRTWLPNEQEERLMFPIHMVQLPEISFYSAPIPAPTTDSSDEQLVIVLTDDAQTEDTIDSSVTAASSDAPKQSAAQAEEVDIVLLPEPEPALESVPESVFIPEPAPEPEPAPMQAEATDPVLFADGGGVMAQGGGGGSAVPEQDEVALAAAEAPMMRTFSDVAPMSPAPPQTLTPAEAEGILRAYLGDGEFELHYGGVLLNGGYHRFDRVDTGETYAVSLDGGQVLLKGAPEAAFIADWDVQ